MSQYYEVDHEPVWNPGMLSSQVFLGYVRVYEDLLAVPSGLGPMRSDECQIDPPVFEAFVNAVLEWWDHTRSLVVEALVEGFVATLVVLAERVGVAVRWPERSEASGRAASVRDRAGDLRRDMGT